MSNKHTRTLTQYPSEIWIIIFSNLKITDAINLGRVDKQIREIYLDLVKQTKYIDYNYNNRRTQNNEMSKYIKNILRNISIGNRTVILKIYPDECAAQLTQSLSPEPFTGMLNGDTMDPVTTPHTPLPQSPIFKIINLSTMVNSGLKIYLMNKENIRIIYLDMLNNNIMCCKTKENYDLVLKFIKNTPFNAKTRPLQYQY